MALLIQNTITLNNMNKEEQFILEKIADATGTAEVAQLTVAELCKLLVRKGVLTGEEIFNLGVAVIQEASKK